MLLYVKQRKTRLIIRKRPLPKPPIPTVKARSTLEETLEQYSATPAQAYQPRAGLHVLDKENHDPLKQVPTDEIVARIIALAQAISEKRFYPYQIELGARIVESLLEHDGEVITALMARQMGKTEVLGAIVAAIAFVFPALSRQRPDDWKLNITDDQGVYRGYADGIRIGIYAPRLEQADIMYQRVKKALETDTGAKVMKELKLAFIVNNGGKVKLSNGSQILCESASEQSKIEGATHHFLICEECQDITDLKIKKSLHPMVASTMGTIVKIGTATTQKCDFYTAIKTNERCQLSGGRPNHFFYPYTVGERYNSLYRQYIKGEKQRLSEDSDEFRTSYCGEWIFERGMFATPNLLFHHDVAQTIGKFSKLYDNYLPKELQRYSLVAGIDWGQSYDSTVVTLLAVDWNNPISSGYHVIEGNESFYTYYQKHLISWLEFSGDNYEHQFHEIMDYLSRFQNLRRIVMDSNTGGAPMLARFESVYNGTNIDVEGFNFQARLKSDGYKQLYGDLCGHRITFPADAETRKRREFKKFVNQMLDLKKEYDKGLMVVAHPEEKGAHDDFPDSFMLANYGANMDSVSDIEAGVTNFLR